MKWTFENHIKNKLGCTAPDDCYSLYSNEETPCLEELYWEGGVQYMALYLPVEPDETNPEGYFPKEKPEILRMAQSQTQSKALTENVLQGIPHMSYGNPSAVCYIGCVMRLMEYRNDPIEADELFSLSGAALCFPWKSGVCCDEISTIPEILQRSFTALGYESEWMYEPHVQIEPHASNDNTESVNGQPAMTIAPRNYTKEFFVDKIKESIDKGRPVLAFGFTELNYSCLITGYYNDGNGLYLRAYWAPQGTPEGYDSERYYQTENWYEKCCGILLVGDKISERLRGEKAYQYIRENAKIFKEKKTEFAGGQMIYHNFAAYDDMIHWLYDDSWWQEGCDMNFRDCLLKPCGLLLLDYYRAHLREYLQRLEKNYPGAVDRALIAKLKRFGKNFPGNAQSTLHINKCIRSAFTDFSMMRNPAIREKVAEYVKKLKQLDQEIFDCLLVRQ